MKKQQVLPIVLIILFTLLLAARLHLAFIRYFDADEFAHLHWSYLLSQGSLPYRDFFMNFTPFYAWSLIPAAFIQSSAGIIIARMVQCILYVSLVALLYVAAETITKSVLVGLISAVVFMSFPVIF